MNQRVEPSSRRSDRGTSVCAQLSVTFPSTTISEGPLFTGGLSVTPAGVLSGDPTVATCVPRGMPTPDVATVGPHNCVWFN
jgi:hypothetical protein